MKGSNNDGYWNEGGTSIHISILPPFWKTWWAYFIYVLVFVAIIYSIIHYYLKRQRLLHTLSLEQIEAEKLNIVPLVKNYIQSFESLARQRNISLTFNANKEAIEVYIDREKIEQILNNLLSNAFKFTEEGGEIEISVRSRQSTVSSPQSEVNSRQSAIGSDLTED